MNFKDFGYFCHPFKQWRRGRAARLGSAKAPTPVRIRTMPLKPLKQFRGFFMSNFYEKLIKDIGSNPDDASRRDTEMCLFFLSNF
ncbi:hypothetical protein DMB68_09340 [Flavobacterium hydrophilum]|uniref:Uncharacterized protein n=1 Tax=Flavobacterium hydrophilum TaxID=2211445 RepID=A0A2V4C262_9FLAO|nr:hypothetical protein DMB68_09340 [Flavobacterium hydrophilum]